MVRPLSCQIKMKNKGFSLIELMITIVIIGILATIAYPAYTHHVIKAKRAEAKIALLDMANRMERYYSENNYSYAKATLSKLNINNKTPHNYYILSIAKTTPTTYLLQAAPEFKDPECSTLTLNNLGGKNKTGTGKTQECW